ncbi:CBO0543 family protein [Bacillus haimaensis]|uniref:CBO0543 family protein n=1 Tax=Bacillus haimaensis TaxID=3160967 RepID=UPI003AA84E83
MTVDEKVSEGARKVYQLLEKSSDLHIEAWADYVVFTWRWWLLLGLTLIPWIIWLVYRKKESTHRLLFVGFFTIFISLWLDSMGTQLGWWYYKYELIPFTPSFKPWDFSLLPVTTMFFLQFKPSINPFIKGLVYAAIIAFIAEPLFLWLGYYVYPNWEYIYSFFIYFIIYLISHFIVTRNKFERI